jgi:hypothetical protein
LAAFSRLDGLKGLAVDGKLAFSQLELATRVLTPPCRPAAATPAQSNFF